MTTKQHDIFAECMDIFDSYDDGLYEYLYHIYVSKGDDRIIPALSCLSKYALELVAGYAGTEDEYVGPTEYLNQPA